MTVNAYNYIQLIKVHEWWCHAQRETNCIIHVRTDGRIKKLFQGKIIVDKLLIRKPLGTPNHVKPPYYKLANNQEGLQEFTCRLSYLPSWPLKSQSANKMIVIRCHTPKQRASIFSIRHCYKTIRITASIGILSVTKFMIPAPLNGITISELSSPHSLTIGAFTNNQKLRIATEN